MMSTMPHSKSTMDVKFEVFRYHLSSVSDSNCVQLSLRHSHRLVRLLTRCLNAFVQRVQYLVFVLHMDCGHLQFRAVELFGNFVDLIPPFDSMHSLNGGLVSSLL